MFVAALDDRDYYKKKLVFFFIYIEFLGQCLWNQYEMHEEMGLVGTNRRSDLNRRYTLWRLNIL
jgi:hypothetical protein